MRQSRKGNLLFGFSQNLSPLVCTCVSTQASRFFRLVRHTSPAFCGFIVMRDICFSTDLMSLGDAGPFFVGGGCLKDVFVK